MHCLCSGAGGAHAEGAAAGVARARARHAALAAVARRLERRGRPRRRALAVGGRRALLRVLQQRVQLVAGDNVHRADALGFAHLRAVRRLLLPRQRRQLVLALLREPLVQQPLPARRKAVTRAAAQRAGTEQARTRGGAHSLLHKYRLYHRDATS